MSQVVRKELDNIIYTQTNLGDDLRQLKTDVKGIKTKLPDSFDDFVTIKALNEMEGEVILLELRVSLFSSSYCLFRLLGLALSNKFTFLSLSLLSSFSTDDDMNKHIEISGKIRFVYYTDSSIAKSLHP